MAKFDIVDLTAPDVPTVRVRIAVAVTEHRDWEAIGNPDEDPTVVVEELMKIIQPGADEDMIHIIWVEADVPIPQQPEPIEGRVIAG